MKRTNDDLQAPEAGHNGGDWLQQEVPVDTANLSPSASHLGEVIAADSLSFEAECRQIYGAPPFGSFVRVEGTDRTIFGVVAHVATSTTDPGRRTQALHLPPGRLAERMPQLELVLRTCFTALTIGHQEGGELRPHLPPSPPEIHRFVCPCTPGEIEGLTREPDFLRVLAGAPLVPPEELVAAAVLQAASARGSGALADRFLIDCGKALVTLFRREPERFQSIMRRLQSSRCPTIEWERPLNVT